MKVIQFTIPVSKENSIIVQEDELPFFYNHLHRHNEIQITLVLKGEGTLIAGSYMQPFKPGDIYIIGSNQSHIFKSDPPYFDKKSKKKIHALTLFFNPKGAFQNILDLPESKSIKKFVAETTYGLMVTKENEKKIAVKILGLKSAKQAFRVTKFIDLIQIMANIKQWKKLSSISSDYSYSDSEGLRMNDVYQYTLEHYADDISLNDIAKVACLTRHAFCRYFRKHTRKTYFGFLNEIRINEACKQITSENFTSMSFIACNTGFASAVSFSRVFKKVTGQSPREYQKEYSQKID